MEEVLQDISESMHVIRPVQGISKLSRSAGGRNGEVDIACRRMFHQVLLPGQSVHCYKLAFRFIVNPNDLERNRMPLSWQRLILLESDARSNLALERWMMFERIR